MTNGYWICPSRIKKKNNIYKTKQIKKLAEAFCILWCEYGIANTCTVWNIPCFSGQEMCDKCLHMCSMANPRYSLLILIHHPECSFEPFNHISTEVYDSDHTASHDIHILDGSTASSWSSLKKVFQGSPSV